jgi:hypothetical protein
VGYLDKHPAHGITVNATGMETKLKDYSRVFFLLLLISCIIQRHEFTEEYSIFLSPFIFRIEFTEKYTHEHYSLTTNFSSHSFKQAPWLTD